MVCVRAFVCQFVKSFENVSNVRLCAYVCLLCSVYLQSEVSEKVKQVALQQEFSLFVLISSSDVAISRVSVCIPQVRVCGVC